MADYKHNQEEQKDTEEKKMTMKKLKKKN